MQGAREYAGLFRTGQYDRLYIQVGEHARGKTFHIWLLPRGYVVKNETYMPNIPDAVEVYGILGGQPGWTEFYGWLHKGKWCEYFDSLVEQKKADKEEEQRIKAQIRSGNEKEEKERINKLLADY